MQYKQIGDLGGSPSRGERANERAGLRCLTSARLDAPIKSRLGTRVTQVRANRILYGMLSVID